MQIKLDGVRLRRFFAPEEIFGNAVEVPGRDAVGQVLQVDALGQVEVLEVVVLVAVLALDTFRRRNEHLRKAVDQHLQKMMRKLHTIAVHFPSGTDKTDEISLASSN